ncbi:MAG: hypothetical protein GY788_06725, partial [bacterium]|nr:hypothetical protein [bacterium]
GNVKITDLKKSDTLRFHDSSGDDDLTEAQVESASTVTDKGNGKNVKIVIDTAGTGSMTIVLKGIGDGSIESIEDLIDAGYDVTFDA